MPRQPNYYRILDIGLYADQAQIQHAYRTLAKRYHPDLVPQDRREWARGQMTRINAAYEVLSDPMRRATYDRQQGYAGPVLADPSRPRNRAATKASGHSQRIRWRGERWRREKMSRQRLLVLSSTAALGMLLIGALYGWRALARSTWAILLSIGLVLVLVILGRAAR
jgi:curved DNA-binding protein CbpA